MMAIVITATPTAPVAIKRLSTLITSASGPNTAMPIGLPSANTRGLRNSGVAAHRPMLTWPMGLRSEATHGRDLISRRVTG